MALDPRIILAGQAPDVVNVLAQSNQAAQQQKQFQRQNALADFTQANGAALFAGEQNALAGYAGLAGPEAALGLQSQRQDMQVQSQRMAMLTREEQRAIEQHAATLTAAERAAEAQKVEDAVKMGLAIQSPDEWDRVMQTQAPDLIGQFDNRQALAQRFMSMAEILKKQQADAAALAGPDWRAADPTEAARYGAAGGQINHRTGEFKPINPPSGMSLTTNADGSTTFQQGPGAAKPFTEGQSKDVGFAARGRAALAALEPVADALTSRGNRMLDYVPLGIGREFQSGDFQVAQNAADTFLLSLLRKDTGAAVTEGEQQIYGKRHERGVAVHA